MAADLDKAVIDLELRSDGSVRFQISGLPGGDCEELEALLLEVLQGTVQDRGHTHEFYQRVEAGLGQRLRALLGRG
jgi:hypothetical protein